MDRDQRLELWLSQVIKDPIEEWEIAHLQPHDFSHPDWNPEYSFPRSDLSYVDTEIALEFDSEGVPIWWSTRHPRTKERLTTQQRRAWFLRWLSDVWRASDPRLLRGARSHRRRRLAIELLVLYADLARDHTWEDVPFD